MKPTFVTLQMYVIPRFDVVITSIDHDDQRKLLIVKYIYTIT
jgi:hypothetical protein